MKRIAILAALAAALFVPVATAAPKVTVVMHEPGCHAFMVRGKFLTRLTRSQPVTLVNYDEAALKIVGPGGTRFERVGGSLTLRRPGLYRITMVGQEPMDYTLKLRLR